MQAVSMLDGLFFITTLPIHSAATNILLPQLVIFLMQACISSIFFNAITSHSSTF